MQHFRDFAGLHRTLRQIYETVSPEGRRPVFVYALQKAFGFTTEQAELYASTVLCQDAEGSADSVMTNGMRVTGSWIRGGAGRQRRRLAFYHEGDLAVQYRSHLRA